MPMHLQANIPAVEDLLARLTLTSYTSLVEARVQLGQQIRLTMQYPQTYNTPIEQKLPAEHGIDSAAQYVHPWNIACALMNVCLNGIRFGGDNLAPQEDLMVYAGDWQQLMGCTFPTAVVPKVEQEPAPTSAAPPAPDPTPPILPSAEAQQPLPVPDPTETNSPPNSDDISDLPDSSITIPRIGGQSGRPQKSPFEKKVEPRKKVADPPFWWKHMLVSAPLVFSQSPAAALDDSSTGVGPVQSYMVLLDLLKKSLKGVDPRVTVASLRTFLNEVDEQVSKLPDADAINQLRKELQ